MSEYTEDDLREAFQSGYAAGRNRGNFREQLEGIKKRTANTLFEKWVRGMR